jgi:peptidoglycan/LPS O-acetylase OafA/YrhL
MRAFPASELHRLPDDLRSPTLGSFLDMARWMAAALVFVGHLRNPLFLGYAQVPPEHRNLIVQAWYFVTGLTAEAVTVFFVLSGLLVGAAGLARRQAGRFVAADYAIDRLTRLYLPFLPALLLGFALDVVGSRVFASVGFWDHSHPMVAQKIGTPPFTSMLDTNILLGNILMLQHYLVPPLGSNQPLWTISAEFWFYAVFLFALGAAGLAKDRVARVAAFLALAAVVAFLGSRFLVLLGLWSIGVAIGLVPAGRWRSLPVATGVFLLLLLGARLSKDVLDTSAVLREAKNYAIAMSFAYLVCCMRGRRFPWLEKIARPNAFMASFSYSLYLLHFPVMLFLLGALHATGLFPGIARGFDPTNWSGISVYLMVTLLVLGSCWLFSLATERNTERVRRLLKSKLPRPVRDAAVRP